MSRAAITRLRDVEAKPIEWLWPGHIPLGMLTVFDGDPGLGKSTILADLTARLSRGDVMPDGSPGPRAAGTIILSAEDDSARVIRPRLDAAGADPDKVVFLGVVEGEGSRELNITQNDMEVLEEGIETVGAKLVTIDPLMAYLPLEVNSNRDQDVRRTLVLLRDLAERTGTAIVVVRHLNKNLNAHALYRGGGSIGIIGAARAALLLAADPDNPDTGRVLAVAKSNLARIPPSLRLQLVQEEGHDFATVFWGDVCDLSASRLLAAGQDSPSRRAKDTAKDFLSDALVDGPVAASEIEAEAEEAGIAKRTLKRAKKQLGVTATKIGKPGEEDQHWVWALPGNGPRAEEGQKRASSPNPNFGLLRSLQANDQVVLGSKSANYGSGPLRENVELAWDSADQNIEGCQATESEPLPSDIEAAFTDPPKQAVP